MRIFALEHNWEPLILVGPCCLFLDLCFCSRSAVCGFRRVVFVWNKSIVRDSIYILKRPAGRLRRPAGRFSPSAASSRPFPLNASVSLRFLQKSNQLLRRRSQILRCLGFPRPKGCASSIAKPAGHIEMAYQHCNGNHRFSKHYGVFRAPPPLPKGPSSAPPLHIDYA